MGATAGDKGVLARALEVARSLDHLSPRVHDMKGLRKFLGFSTQRFNNWKKRGVPKAGIFLLSDRLGVPVEMLRGLAGGEVVKKEEEHPSGGEMTDQEALLLMAFRQADEATRAKFMELARQAVLPKFSMRPAPPAQPSKPRIA